MRKGRPREFDPERAIDSALALFWRHGYEGTSIASLTAAMRMSPPSIYAAFGNKEGLFRKALDRYDEKYGAYFRAALAEPTARLVAEKLMFGAVHQVTRPSHPDGCLLVQGALACNDAVEPVKSVLIEVRAAAEIAIRKRFERAIEEGDLPRSADATHLARLIWTLNLGFAVQAAGGMSRNQLRALVESVLQCWPVLIQSRPRTRAHGRRTRTGTRTATHTVASARR